MGGMKSESLGMSKTPAHQRPWVETPLTESAALSKAAGCRVLLKHDHLQPSGSFKSRGLGYYMMQALARSTDSSKVHFYCSSGGNAGLACVHAANALGRPSTIVVPLSTKDFMVAKLRAAGAKDVLQIGENWAAADHHLRDVVIKEAESRGEDAVYVMPFDHKLIWTGHSSIVDEIEAQLGSKLGLEKGRPDLIICSSGGGGLFNGICEGVERKGWDSDGTEVLVMGTVGADSLWQCREKGEHVRLERITSQATSLGATKVSDRSYELVSTRKWVRTGRLTDEEAAMGCWRFADDERIIVELACGVNTALAYGGRLEKVLGRKVKKDDIVVIEVCGGSAVTLDMLCQWKKDYGHLGDELSEKEMAQVPSATTNGGR